MGEREKRTRLLEFGNLRGRKENGWCDRRDRVVCHTLLFIYFSDSIY